MFIYSNHYLILSKLTQEDFKNYFTGIKGDTFQTTSFFNEADPEFDMYHTMVIEDTGYLLEIDYADLAYYIYEPHPLVYMGSAYIDPKFAKSPYRDARFPFFPYFNSRHYAFDADNIDHDILRLQNCEIPDYAILLHDHMGSNTTSEPFYPYIYLNDRSFYLVPSKVEFDPTRENKEEFIIRKKKDTILRYKLIFRKIQYKLFYDDKDHQDIKYKAFPYPIFRKIAPHNPEVIWFLSYKNVPLNEGKFYRDYSLIWWNDFVPRNYLLNDDKNDREYWHEPSFAFPMIREMLKSQRLGKDYVYPVVIREQKKFEHQYPLRLIDNFFPLSYTATATSMEFFTITQYDPNVERFD